MGGMGGMGGGDTNMVFINLRRKAELPPGGVDQLAKDFQGMLHTGGVEIPIVGVEDDQLIAICNNLIQVIELRKFVLEMDQVLNIIHDKETYWS